MIKLSTNQAGIRIDGRLTEETIPQLQELIGAAAGQPLDLSGLTSLDGPARSFLIALRTAGHELAGGSLYIRQLLEEVQP